VVTVGDPPPLLFALSGLAWADDARRRLHPAEGAAPPSLGGWAELPSLELALAQLTPLLRALELAGYSTELVQLAVATADRAPPDRWVQIWTGLMEAEEASSVVPIPWPAGARLTVALLVSVRRSATAESLAIPAEIGPMPFPAGWNTDAAGQALLIFATDEAVATGGELVAALDGSATLRDEVAEPVSIAAFVDGVIHGLAERWKFRFIPGNELNPLVPGSVPGLLWLFDPTYWDTDPPTWDGPDALWVRDIAAEVLTFADIDPEGFLRDQIIDLYRVDLRKVTLGGLLEQLRPDRGEARNAKRDFFNHLDNRFAFVLEHKLGGVLEAPSLRAACGQRWLGYPSPIRWLELIMYIAEARLLPFPALLRPELGYDFEFDEDPIEVTLTPKEDGVEIRVLGSEPLVLRREGFKNDYDVEECFTWEYLGADEEGIATLVVVAAPGVSVSGQENLAPGSCRLVIYRVQDHEAVPAWGEHIPTPLEGPYDEGALRWRDWAIFEDGEPPGEIGAPGSPPPKNPGNAEAAFRVHPLPLGIRISYPAGAAKAEFTVDIQVDEGAADQRFAYEITPTGGNAGDRQAYALVVRATEMVRIGVRHDLGGESRILDHYQRTTSIYAVTAPGVPLSADLFANPFGIWSVPPGDPEFQRLLWEEYKQQWLQLLAPMFVDVGVGLIPVFGDAIDIDEFLFSFVTGTDRWGSPVTNIDQAIMFGGMLVPFVSNGAMRALLGT
jgi:hypothetical protein